jgi:type IV secretory pathway VirJ component
VRPADDAESACAEASAGATRVVTLPGSHHFNGRYADVAEAIVRFIDAVSVHREISS